MSSPAIHRFVRNGKRYALDTETCFCFECDEISWDVLDHFPHTPVSRIHQLLADRHPATEINEVIGELEWLRATKSILRPLDKATAEAMFESEQGLRLMTVHIKPDAVPDAPQKSRWPFGRAAQPAASATTAALLRNAALLLMSRSLQQKSLEMRVRSDEPNAFSPDVCEVLAEILKTSTLAGKDLSISLSAGFSAVAGHRWEARVDVSRADAVKNAVSALETADRGDIKKCAKAFSQLPDGVTGRVRLIPGHPDFAETVKAFREAGFAAIELDLDAYFVAATENVAMPEAMLPALEAVATYYADELLQGRYFRLDPIAPVFWRIYQGQPLRRVDPAGTQELAADENGALYPSRHWVGREKFHCGSLADGTLNSTSVNAFEDVGSVTTVECITCWARNLCGGGCAAVHEARSGSFRRPDAAWCDFQREWMASAVVAFDRLAVEGVNFTRVYQNLRPTAKPSLMTLARAAFRMSIGMRPIEENDAAFLTEWENWTEAAYFLCGENGLLLATKYDREMDALHPGGVSQEFLLLRKDGAPFGLMRLSPDRWEGTARAGLYFRGEEDYASDAVRKSFRFLLKEAAGDQKLRRLTTQALVSETGLCAFLESIGFEAAGELRDAVFLHGEYRPARVYVLAAEKL